MSLQSRVSLGFGFGALAVAMMGYMGLSAPPTATASIGGGRPARIPARKGVRIRKLRHEDEDILFLLL